MLAFKTKEEKLALFKKQIAKYKKDITLLQTQKVLVDTIMAN